MDRAEEDLAARIRKFRDSMVMHYREVRLPGTAVRTPFAGKRAYFVMKNLYPLNLFIAGYAASPVDGRIVTWIRPNTEFKRPEGGRDAVFGAVFDWLADGRLTDAGRTLVAPDVRQLDPIEAEAFDDYLDEIAETVDLDDRVRLVANRSFRSDWDEPVWWWSSRRGTAVLA